MIGIGSTAVLMILSKNSRNVVRQRGVAVNVRG